MAGNSVLLRPRASRAGVDRSADAHHGGPCCGLCIRRGETILYGRGAGEPYTRRSHYQWLESPCNRFPYAAGRISTSLKSTRRRRKMKNLILAVILVCATAAAQEAKPAGQASQAKVTPL